MNYHQIIKMSMKTLDGIKNHLEFLGYSVEMPEIKEGEKSILIAISKNDPNIVVIEIGPGMVIFRSNFNISRPVSEKMNKAINDLSGLCDVVNPYYKIENDKVQLYFDSVYTGEYVKDTFAQYISFFNRDIAKMYRVPEIHDVFKDEK